jgi:hypothetical protein
MAVHGVSAPVTKLIARFSELRKWSKIAEAQTGKRAASQFKEIYQLRHAGGQCGIWDYYSHKLYDDNYLRGRGRKDFLGWRLLEEFSRSLNPRHAVLPAWDKIVFALTAEAAGLPIAPTAACFHPARRVSSIFGKHLQSVDETREFLKDASVYPLFGKPVFSQGGHGAAYLSDISEDRKRIHLLDGNTMALETFLERLTTTVDRRYHKPQCGYLFQRPLQQHPTMLALTNWSAICSVRVICLNDLGSVIPIRAALKLAVPPNHTDNFSDGSTGNLLANVNLQTGALDITVGGMWPETEVYYHYPDTGARLEDFIVPGWDSILAACQEAGKVYPLMKIHHWDFGITDEGPKIMELNDIGGTQIAQMHGHGLLTEEVRRFVKTHADHHAHPWAKAL